MRSRNLGFLQAPSRASTFHNLRNLAYQFWYFHFTYFRGWNCGFQSRRHNVLICSARPSPRAYVNPGSKYTRLIAFLMNSSVMPNFPPLAPLLMV